MSVDLKSPNRLINRELSWLEFNCRVLEEASNPKNPLLEKLKFLSISDKNLDEFYMVRVAGLKRKKAADIGIVSKEGFTTAEQLDYIYKKTKVIFKDQSHCFNHLCEDLKEQGVEIIKSIDLKKKELEWLEDYFLKKIFPAITPLAIDPLHPFPVIPNDALSIVLKLFDKEHDRFQWSIIPIPQNMQRFIKICDENKKLLPTEDAIRLFLRKVMPNFSIISSGYIHLIRDSEMDIDDDLEDVEELLESFKSALNKRKHGSVIRLMVNKDIDPDLIEFATNELHVEPDAIFEIDGILNLSDIEEISFETKSKFKFQPHNPVIPDYIKEVSGDIFSLVKQKDVLLHHPYESFDSVVDLLEQAANDPNVISIKQTLYRTSDDSPIVKALAQAAEHGKSVTVVIELKARFDEEQNINLAEKLENSGAQVVFGFMKYKTHVKLLLISRKEENEVVNYLHFSTGNYHPITAKIYTDLSYFSADQDLALEATKVFNYITGYVQPVDLESFSISPLYLQKNIFALIDNEIENLKAGKPAGIWVKLNSLVDSKIIDKLYEASNAGVKIELVIRGICCLKPGIKGLSENIRVRSIVGRFLEHSRLVCFANGEEFSADTAKVFISSADWMPRSFHRRVEAMISINDKEIKRRILDEIMFLNLNDTEQTWFLDSEGRYHRYIDRENKQINIHQEFIDRTKED